MPAVEGLMTDTTSTGSAAVALAFGWAGEVERGERGEGRRTGTVVALCWLLRLLLRPLAFPSGERCCCCARTGSGVETEEEATEAAAPVGGGEVAPVRRPRATTKSTTPLAL